MHGNILARRQLFSSAATSALTVGSSSVTSKTVNSSVFRQAGVTGYPQAFLNSVPGMQPYFLRAGSGRADTTIRSPEYLFQSGSDKQQVLKFINSAVVMEPAHETLERAREYAKARYLAPDSKMQTKIPLRRISKAPSLLTDSSGSFNRP